jgi:tagatose 6-phosphate kinase
LIVAAGLTPAWQQIMRFDGFRPGEVNRAIDVHRCASGKVLNVAVALAHLGAPCEVVSLLGGWTGEQIDREFTSLGIRRRWVATHWATRVCTTILDNETARTTELVENAGPATAAELDEFRRVYAERAAQAQFVILSGSLPAGAPSSYFRDLLALAPSPAILDIRGAELIAALERPVFLVKPNREELAATLAEDLSGDDRLRAAMARLNERGCEWVLVTDGPRAAWVSSREGFFRFTPPKLASVNPIGAGDCLAAGLAWGLSNGAAPLAAIQIGMAAAAENVEQLLPARLDPETVLARAPSITFERVP